jgi:hypothetical protein
LIRVDLRTGDVIAMFDERLYKRWDKLSEALKTDKAIGEKQGEDIESTSDKANRIKK